MTDKTDGPGKPAAEGGAPKKPSAIIELKATEVEDKEGGAAKPDEPGASEREGEKGAGKPAQTASPTGPAAQRAAAIEGAEPEASPRPASAAESGAERAPTSDGSEPRSDTGAARRSSGVVAPIAAGLAGGILALLGTVTIGPQLGFMSDPWTKHASELQSRIASIEQKTAEQAAAAAELRPKLAAAEGRLARLAELSDSVNQLGAAYAKLAGDTEAMQQELSKPKETSDLGGRIAKLEETLATLSAAAANDPASGRLPQLAAITGKLNDIESTFNNQLAALRNSLAQEIDARVGHIAEASEAAKSGTQRIDRELAAMKEDAARLAQHVEALKATENRLDQDLHVAREETASLSGAMQALKDGVAGQLRNVARVQDVNTAIEAIAARVSALDENVQGVVKSEENRKTDAERIVLALELGNLRRALDRGGAYAAELAELEKVAGGKVDLAALEPYKDQGVPTTGELARGFRAAANAVIDAEAQPPDASVVDRLLTGARSIVRIRRTDHGAEDKSMEAILARMEKGIKDAKLTDALAEAQQLPPKARAAANGWLGRLEARATVDRAIAQIEDQLKASLAGNAQVEKRSQ